MRARPIDQIHEAQNALGAVVDLLNAVRSSELSLVDPERLACLLLLVRNRIDAALSEAEQAA